MMQGMNLKTLKKHPALIPLYVCTAVGMSGALYYTLRLATRNPDVAWNRSQFSNEYYRNKQYKFYSSVRDYTNIDSPAPKYEE
ncbi:Cytochrome c oxidase subunit NDUFA4 [Pseudolycoriella hygida]|uniref:Cytochrome c oxidase subunit NDUFA4 n=1 Tax=Pseudolycoriella hygida TaxID=35572 RepID=A0A9Q0MMA1_9DIPT|nr:Cytochrome c oxidase subunit NDUFA4 [Pseudolycoriella hygida]